MTVNKVRASIVIAASGLIAFALFQWFDGAHRILLAGGAFVMLGAALLGLFAFDLATERLTANARIASSLFFGLSMCSNIAFSLFDFRAPAYVITNGLLTLAYALVLNFVNGEPG